MEFTEKNDFVVNHSSSDSYDKDIELFKKYCPGSRLHSDLKRVNLFTRKKLDGFILFELLDKISTEEILKNRVENPITPKVETEQEKAVEREPIVESKTEPEEKVKKKDKSKKNSPE